MEMDIGHQVAKQTDRKPSPILTASAIITCNMLDLALGLRPEAGQCYQRLLLAVVHYRDKNTILKADGPTRIQP